MRKVSLTKAMAVAGIAGCTMMMMAGCGSTSSSGSSDNKSGSAQTEETAKNLSGSVSTNGSTSMEKVIGNLSEQFMQDNSGVKITYDATGSGTGVESASNGTCDIGLASRDLKDDEKNKGLTQTTIALDGIAIIVNKDNPVKDLSVDKIADIYTGKIKNWKDAGGKDAEISAIGREAGSGTRDGFETITDTKDKCVLSQELTSTGAVIEAVKNSPNAIGYASFSDAEGKDGITILTVGGVKCSEDTISDGTYKIQRDFNLITKKDKKLSAQAQAFFDYMTSKDAAAIIEKAGVVPKNK
jgi:phosphate transport system substrate-binding protein